MGNETIYWDGLMPVEEYEHTECPDEISFNWA